MAKNIQDGLVNSVRHGDITDTHLTMTDVTAFVQREQELLTHIKTFETSNPCLSAIIKSQGKNGSVEILFSEREYKGPSLGNFQLKTL